MLWSAEYVQNKYAKLGLIDFLVLACGKIRDTCIDLLLSYCRARKSQLEDLLWANLKVIKIIKNIYHKVNLLLLHVFVFKQKGGMRNLGSVIPYKFSNCSTDAIKQILTY